jgi:hypothetical protein
MIASKKFNQDYMTMDCHSGGKVEAFTFPHLMSSSATTSTKKVCDYVINGTVVLYSHDNIRNMAHTMNDIMNVWLMLWLDGKASTVTDIPLLTIDALKQYNNFDDLVNQYYTTYQHNFRSILRGLDFGAKSSVCLERVLMQPLPSRGFVWDNWHTDLPCSFVGPSSLYQRWNLHARVSLGLLRPTDPPAPAPKPLKVVLIVRTESQNDWGSYRTSRLFLNLQEITAEIAKLQKSADAPPFELVVQNLADLDFAQQLQLISQTSVLVGIHGAGIAHSQYMSVGAAGCCGVLEMFPQGEFTPVRGFANMVRKMGAHYERIDIAGKDSRASGALVPVQEMAAKLGALLRAVTERPSCVLPQVVDDFYLQKVL